MRASRGVLRRLRGVRRWPEAFGGPVQDEGQIVVEMRNPQDRHQLVCVQKDGHPLWDLDAACVREPCWVGRGLPRELRVGSELVERLPESLVAGHLEQALVRGDRALKG